MAAYYRCICIFMLFYGATAVQAEAADFQFPASVKPGDTLTVPGTDLAGVKDVTLTGGKRDLAGTNVSATATGVTFTVPAEASGIYQVMLSPSKRAAIPLTVTVAASTATPPPPPPTGAPPTTGKPVIDS